MTYAINYRETLNSFNELPKDKRPPRNLWDKPYKLSQHFDEVFETGDSKTTQYVEFDPEEVE